MIREVIIIIKVVTTIIDIVTTISTFIIMKYLHYVVNMQFIGNIDLSFLFFIIIYKKAIEILILMRLKVT